LKRVPERLPVLKFDKRGGLWAAGEYGAMYVNAEAAGAKPGGRQQAYHRKETFRVVLGGDTRCYTISGRRYDFSSPTEAIGAASGYRIWWNGNQAASVVTTTGREHHVVR